MKRLNKYDGIDFFRMIAAFLAVGAHTYPFSSISNEMNYLFIHIFARIAVPFFMMATGYFLLPRFFDNKYQTKLNGLNDLNDSSDQKSQTGQRSRNKEHLNKFIKKTGLLYFGTIILYLPVSIYAGYYSNGNVAGTFIRNLVFDGTFYHLWYLPAVILGVTLIYILSLKCSLRLTFGITVILYILGILGDNYYGIIEKIPVMHALYETGFHVFSYTRNGLFYAPVFLTMGALIAARQEKQNHPRFNMVGFIICMILMATEGMLLRHFAIPRHTSMYLMLLPCMYFLFGFVKSHTGKRSLFMRDTSMWIYILHPLVIIAIRGGARIIGLTDLFVENSIVFFIFVCGLSLICSIIIGMRKKSLKDFC